MQKIESIFSHFCKRHQIHSAQLMVSRFDEEVLLSYGNISPDSKIYIASASEIFVATCFMKFHQDNRLNVEDPISNWISSETLDNLLVLNGKNYSK